MNIDYEKPKVAVVGLGKLGLPLALVINSGGYEVVGYDLNTARISELKNKFYRGAEPSVLEMLTNSKDTLEFSDSIDSLRNCSVAYIIVPTPSDESGVFASNYVEDAISQIRKCWVDSTERKVIVIVSTVMPGTTQKITEKYLNQHNEKKIELIYSPEFIALGSVIQNLYNPDALLIGSESDYATQLHLTICKSYLKTEPEIQILSPTEAELAKIMVNTYVTMKISFANFVGEISSKVQGIDASKVTTAIGADTRIGKKYLRPGLGFGGPCFPRDNKALIAFAKSIGLKADLAIATDQINDRQPDFFISRIKTKIERIKKIGVLGLSYKENSEVYEASQGIILANKLQAQGFEIYCFDNYILERPLSLDADVRFTNEIQDLSECEVLLELIDSTQNRTGKNWEIPILKP